MRGHHRPPIIEEGRPLCTICKERPCRRKYKRPSGLVKYTKYCKNCWKRRRKEQGPLPQHSLPPEVMALRAQLGINSHSRPHRKHVTTRCNRCGFIPEHIGQLDVHHKDHNHSNNHPSNLTTLCANCHRLHHIQSKISENRPLL